MWGSKFLDLRLNFKGKLPCLTFTSAVHLELIFVLGTDTDQDLFFFPLYVMQIDSALFFKKSTRPLYICGHFLSQTK